MENFYDRINKHLPDDGKYHGEDLIQVDIVKGCYYTWMEDVLLKLDGLKNSEHTIDEIKEIINAKSIHHKA